MNSERCADEMSEGDYLFSIQLFHLPNLYEERSAEYVVHRTEVVAAGRTLNWDRVLLRGSHTSADRHRRLLRRLALGYPWHGTWRTAR